jgi:hypothetical protein
VAGKREFDTYARAGIQEAKQNPLTRANANRLAVPQQSIPSIPDSSRVRSEDPQTLIRVVLRGAAC